MTALVLAFCLLTAASVKAVEHENVVGPHIHVPYNWTYANDAARVSATGFNASHIGKLARQTDTNELWMLLSTTPTWQLVGTADLTHMTNTLGVAHGGTGNATLTANSLLAGGTTGTGALQSVGLGTGTTVLHGNATGLPLFAQIVNADVSNAAAIAGSKINPDFGSQDITTTGTVSMTDMVHTGTAAMHFINSDTLITAASFSGVGSSLTALNASNISSGTLGVARGGSGGGSFTAYSLICGGTTSTGAFQNVSGVGTGGNVLTSNGAGALPTWQSLPGTGTVTHTGGALTANAVMLGAGSGDTKVLGSLGTVATVLHGNASGVPSFGSIVNADVDAAAAIAGTKIAPFFGAQQIAAISTPGDDAVILNLGNAASASIMTVNSNASADGEIILYDHLGTPKFNVSATTGTIGLGTWAATTIDVAHGGTGSTASTAYSVICGGTTSTGAFQNVSGLGSSGNVLTSNGPGALPTWQAAATGTVTHTGSALTAGALMVGAGSNDSTVLNDLGTTSQVLHGNAGGSPTWSQIVNADVSSSAAIAGSKISPDFTGLNVRGGSYSIPQASTGKYVATQTTNNVAQTHLNFTSATSVIAVDIGINAANGGLIRLTDNAGYTITLTGSSGNVAAASFTGSGSGITGLPISTGVSGLGTGVATALAVNTGSAGAFVTYNGAGGTPSALVLTNATGLPFSSLASATNTAASMVVGTGASLAASGSGTIAATTITGSIVKANTPLTTKGDLWVTDGTAMNRLAVGTDTFVLTADAASTNGVKWAAAGGGGSAFSAITGATNTSAAMVVGTGASLATSGTGTNVATSVLTQIPAVAATSTAGTATSIASSDAIAGNVTAGAAAGGAMTITTGAAKRLTSGNADGGSITVNLGSGIGTGKSGLIDVKWNAVSIFQIPQVGASYSGANNCLAGTSAGTALTSGARTTAFGVGALSTTTSNSDNTAFGYQALNLSTSSQCTAVGSQSLLNANGSGVNNTAVGYKAGNNITSGTDNTFIGWNAGTLVASTSTNNVMIGSSIGSVNVAYQNNTLIGAIMLTGSSAQNSVSVGYGSGSSSNMASATVIGTQAQCGSGLGHTVIGFQAGLSTNITNSGTGVILLGSLADTPSSSLSSVLIAGSGTYPATDLYFGKGATNATATAYNVNGTGGSGTNNAGADVIVAGGKGTGTAASGRVGIKYPLVTTTGTTLQTLSTMVNVSTGVIYVATADGTLTANTSTTGSIVGAQTGVTPAGTVTLDANVWRPGRMLRIKGNGLVTTSAAGPTFKLDIKLGSTVVATSGASAPIGSITNGGFKFEATLVCRTTGSTGTVQGDGMMIQENPTTFVPQVYSLNKSVTTVDTTGALTVDAFGTWSAGTAGNTVTVTNLTVEWGN